MDDDWEPEAKELGDIESLPLYGVVDASAGLPINAGDSMDRSG
jgi:hypothetical protein